MSVRGYVNAPRFNARVRWERNQIVTTTSGGKASNWVPLLTSHAGVDATKANEIVIDGGIRTPQDYTVWIRSDVFERLQLSTRDRGIWLRPRGDLILNIAGVPDQGLEGRLIAVICRAGLNKG
jgi:head-tail adaptor